MSRLTIVDLEFYQSELPHQEKLIRGGITVYSPSGGTWSSSNSSSRDSGYSTGYSVDKNTQSVSYYITGGVSGGVSGAVAGAIADGSTYAYTSTNTGTY